VFDPQAEYDQQIQHDYETYKPSATNNGLKRKKEAGEAQQIARTTKDYQTNFINDNWRVDD
jgi:hypothetical protein